MRAVRLPLAVSALAIALASALAAQPIPFAEHVLASDLKSGYHVAIADLNGDGIPDIIALAQGGTDLYWFEGPKWQKHILATGLSHMINCAAGDPGPDGIPDIVVAWEFANDASKSIGKVGVLHHDGDPRQPWKLRQIDEIPTAHRIRFADVFGDGHRVALNAVLTGPKAAPPAYAGDHAPLLLYRPGEWKREVVSPEHGLENEGVQHGILVTRWNRGDTKDSLLTSSFSGIDLYQWNGGVWTRTEISKGDPAPCPKCGSSDTALGYLGNAKFLAAIEPWHGNQVVIYAPNGSAPNSSRWTRSVIDDSLLDGHTIVAADFDGDGRDEIVAGFRQGAKSVFLYRADAQGVWRKQILDPAMPGAACVAGDLNGDGAIDLVCIGGNSLKWYENLTPGLNLGKHPAAAAR